ncbi:MAG: ComEC/Rec2 family competence protein [Aureliella sp.]
MGYEVDFLPVGSGEKSGDAIALRFGDLTNPLKQFVVVIDGGTKESGQALVKHITTYFNTSYVDLVLNTHPDADHASGLTVVLEQLTVGRLWMHQPWEHSSQICHMFNDGRITSGGLSARVKAALENARELEKLANRKNIPITEPFAGLQHSDCGGLLTVLGPTQQYYEALLTDFRSTPEKKEAALDASLWKSFLEGAGALATRVAESLGVETLEEPDDDATSAENNSSAILLLQVDGQQLLFTGDAGVPALERADDWAEESAISLSACGFSQIPHHGSRRNVGPSILDRIVGPKRSYDAPDKVAFVSAANDAPKHPSRKVTNAYRRRGAKVITTEGKAIWHSNGAPYRSTYSAATPVPFHTEVEED